ncbi:MAG: CHASE2 domain-containing protein [Elainellaceae cyanobacterium]
MSKRAVLELKGNLDHQGFYVTLHIGQSDVAASTSIDGYLPPSTRLSKQLTQWQHDYRRLSTPTRAIKPYRIKYDGTINPIETCIDSAQQLVQQFQQWLRADSFRDIDVHLRQALMPSDAIQVLIRTASAEAQALPWHLWDFVEQYPKAEIALSGMRSHPGLSERNAADSDQTLVNILAVLGDRQNIDIDSDRQSLNQLPGTQVEFLVEPSHHQLNEALYEQSWDILFFAGHSETEPEGQGVLRLNATTYLTIDEVRYGLRRAIANGLKLAIFNSCDGLGLARDLADLQLTHMIVMREAVPDAIAQQFLKYFLRAFAQGQPLHLAEREARERLQGLEKDYPCASWLPIVYQQPGALSLEWSDLFSPDHQAANQLSPAADSSVAASSQTNSHRRAFRNYGTALICSVLVSSLVVGVRSLGGLQTWELKAYDHLMRVRPGQNAPDDRILIVAVSEEDIQYQRSQGMEMEGSLSDDALLKLLQKISPHHPSVVGLDIIHDFPFSQALQPQLADQGLIAICRARNTVSNLAGIAPPTKNFPENQLGFSNIPLDPDNVIRRQFLGMPPDEICPTEQAFSFRIAQDYLEKRANMSMEWITTSPNESQQIRLGHQIFQRLQQKTAGYQLSSEDAGGYQVLINYRAKSPEKVYLREILSGSLDSQLKGLVGDRIVLIGVVNPQIDTHLTPYSRGGTAERMPGVVVHAHMISTVISTALGERPLLSGWAEWTEILWIAGWAMVGAIVVGWWRSPYLRVISLLVGLTTLWGVCLLLFVQGWWVPLVPSALALGLAAMFSLSLYKMFEHK